MKMPLLPTTLVGSNSQPDWRIDRDFGFKYLPRDVSFAKLQNMVRGRDIVSAELA